MTYLQSVRYRTGALLFAMACSPKDPLAVAAGNLFDEAPGVHELVVPGPYRVKSSDREACLGTPRAQATDTTLPPAKAICGEDALVVWDLSVTDDGRALVLRTVGSNPVCLEPEGSSNRDGAAMTATTCTHTPYQRWSLARTVHGAFLLRNEGSGQCLDFDVDHPQYGSPFVQHDCRAHWTQLFLLQRI